MGPPRSRPPLYLSLLLGLGAGCDDGEGERVVSASLSAPLALPTDTDDTLNFGYSLAGIGDLDDDDYQDLVVGAPFQGEAAGQVYVLFGGGDPVGDADPLPLAADTDEDDRLGDSVVALFADSCGPRTAALVAVAAPYSDPLGDYSSVGELRLFDPQAIQGDAGMDPVTSVVGESISFFDDAAPVGVDLLGDDGDQELVLGMRSYESEESGLRNAGGLFIYEVDYVLPAVADPIVLEGGADDLAQGLSVSAMGDLTGEGRATIAAGSNAEAVFLYLVNGEDEIDVVKLGVGSGGDTSGVRTAAAWLGPEDDSDDGGGRLLVLTEPWCGDVGETTVMTAEVWLVDAGGAGTMDSTQIVDEEASCSGPRLPLDGRVDLNRDGELDTIVGAGGGDEPGEATLLFGPGATPYALDRGGPAEFDEVGWAVAMVGDVNGDHFPDAAIGAPGVNEDLGQVRFFYGGNDIDGDGFIRARDDGASSDEAVDCNDLDSTVHPDAEDDSEDSQDSNCDGEVGASGGCGSGSSGADAGGCGCHAAPGVSSGARAADGGALRLVLGAAFGAGVLARRRRPTRRG